MFDNAETSDTTLIGLLEAIRILNEKLNDPTELDKALARIPRGSGSRAGRGKR